MAGKQKKSISANARRQAVFASRMRESGKKRVSFWVTPEEETRLRKILNGNKEPEILELPELVGSEKQISWAIDIRWKRLRELSEFLDPKISWPGLWNDQFSGISHLQGRTISERDARIRRSEIVNAARSIWSAHWWIETRQLSTRDFLLEACDWARVRENAIPTINKMGEVENDKFMEGMIIPPNSHGAIAEIQENNGRILVRLSVFDEEVISILKKHSFHWEDKRGIWERIVKWDSGRDLRQDRAVEVGVCCLQSGHAVFIAEKALRERVAIGDYQPEVFRRIEVGKSERWGLRFRLVWSGEKDSSTLARLVTKIRGTKVYPDAAYAPSSRFEEVEDFAETHGFTLTDEAKGLISQERRAKSLRLVGVDPGLESPSKELRRIKTTMGEIDASLLDDLA